MKAVDTDVMLRFLLNDEVRQSPQAKALFEVAEPIGGRFAVTWPVVLETIWVLSPVYGFRREEIPDALEMLTQMPIFEFQDYGGIHRVLKLGRSTKIRLPDLLIGAAGLSVGLRNHVRVLAYL